MDYWPKNQIQKNCRKIVAHPSQPIDNITFDHRTSNPYNDFDYDDIDRLTEADYLVGVLTEDEAFAMKDTGNKKLDQVSFFIKRASN